MPKKKRDRGKRTIVRVGNVSHINRNVNGGGRNITTNYRTIIKADVPDDDDPLTVEGHVSWMY